MSRHLVRAHAGATTAIVSIDPFERVARRMIQRAGGTPSQMGAEAFAKACCPGVKIHYNVDPLIPRAVSAMGIWLIPERGKAREGALLYLAAANELRGRPGDAATLYATAMGIVEALHRLDAPEVEKESAIVKVDFHGDTIEAISGKGTAWVVVRRVCEALGIQPHGQVEKLKGKTWATTQIICAVAEDGKSREQFCIRLDKLPMWLATIDENRVASQVRPKLKRYQNECAEVLYEHFFGQRAPIAKAEPTPAPAAPAAPAMDFERMARLMGEAIAAAIHPLMERLDRVERAEPLHDRSTRGTISPEQHAIIRHHVATISQARVHAGLAPSANSARAWIYNRLGSAAGWSGTGRAWSLLPSSRYSDVLAELSLMQRDVDAALGVIAERQLPLGRKR